MSKPETLVGIDQLAQLALQTRHVKLRAGRDHGGEDVRRGRLIGLDEGQHEIEHASAVALRDPADAPEVDESHTAVAHREEVALVRVGMKGAYLEDLSQVAADPDLDDLAAVDPRVIHEIGPRAWHARHELHGEHARRRELIDRCGKGDAGVVGECLPEECQIAGLVLVVEFRAQGRHELTGESSDVVGATPCCVFGRRTSPACDDLEVDLHGRSRARPLHLDRHVALVVELGAVDLADRGRRQRHGVEFREELVDVASEFGRDQRPHVLEGQGGNVVLQPCELSGERRRDQVPARGQELAQLHVRRPEPLERTTHANLARRPPTLELGGIVGDLFERCPVGGVVGDLSVLEQKEDSLVPEDGGDLAVALGALVAPRSHRCGSDCGVGRDLAHVSFFLSAGCFKGLHREGGAPCAFVTVLRVFGLESVLQISPRLASGRGGSACA